MIWTRRLTFNYISRNRFVALCTADESFPRRLCFAFLEKACEDFMDKKGSPADLAALMVCKIRFIGAALTPTASLLDICRRRQDPRSAEASRRREGHHA